MAVLEFDQPAAIVPATDQIVERSLGEDLDLGARVKICGERASDEQCERADECCRHASGSQWCRIVCSADSFPLHFCRQK